MYLCVIDDCGMNKLEVKDIVRDEINKFIEVSLDKEIKKLLNKGNTQTRSEMSNIIKTALESVYKSLWQKKDFWQSSIK